MFLTERLPFTNLCLEGKKQRELLGNAMHFGREFGLNMLRGADRALVNFGPAMRQAATVLAPALANSGNPMAAALTASVGQFGDSYSQLRQALGD